MTTLFETLNGLFGGKAPRILRAYLLRGVITPSLKAQITKNIATILAKNPRKHFKFGKTGNEHARAKDFDDYKIAPYTKMYLLYTSTVESRVSELEIYYIRKYKELSLCDNKSEANHKMDQRNGRFYLYMVI
ncbi:MAG: hypothetical protein IT244_11390 [Bacteroidia bacterium]|nr:hypothetical protein [Bacteroidia bacterium]